MQHAPSVEFHHPQGFLSLAKNIGIKDSTLDLAVIYSTVRARAAAMFTRNRFPGAPVIVGRKHVANGYVQALVINSKNANVAMGKQGLDNAIETCRLVGKELGISPYDVLPFSTGVIGRPLPMDKIRAGLKGIRSELKPDNLKLAAEAIMPETAFVSTAIPYVNAKPHVGFALEIVQADAIARYFRLIGYDTFFLTGTDENSLKNVRAAAELGISTQELCDQNSAAFQALIPGLNIANNDFIRTSEETRHSRGAQKLWTQSGVGDIYKKHYTGLYCVGCEDFYTEKEVPNGVCPDHETPLEKVEEENYFFRLSAYQDQLIRLIETEHLRIVPATRKNEMLAFARAGLHDFSISRNRERAGNWGIPVPGDSTQVMYVWYDALANYITALDYADEGERLRKYWIECNKRIHGARGAFA